MFLLGVGLELLNLVVVELMAFGNDPIRRIAFLHLAVFELLFLGKLEIGKLFGRKPLGCAVIAEVIVYFLGFWFITSHHFLDLLGFFYLRDLDYLFDLFSC
jgi:hypothetical protein